MRVVVSAVALAVLTACSGPHTSNTTADVTTAAQQAQGDIDTYAANTLTDTPLAPKPEASPSTARAAAPVGESAVADDDPATDEAPVADDAQAAADVVERYFALIEARDYPRARALWDDAGGASGMTDRQFAASFAGYREYHANVGEPGRIDAGAGQRNVQVPVRTYGITVQDGRPFDMSGSVTLHRTAAIDGATGAQRTWHIRSVSLQPRALQRAATSDPAPGYDCAGTTRVSTRDDRRPTQRADGSTDTGAIWYRDEGNQRIPCTSGG